jgi:hypothetical protein
MPLRKVDQLFEFLALSRLGGSFRYPEDRIYDPTLSLGPRMEAINLHV